MLGDQANAWLEAELPNDRRDAVMEWLAGLATGQTVIVMVPFPSGDPSVAVRIPNTNLSATCIFVEVLGTVVVEKFGEIS